MKKLFTILAFAAAMILAGCQREADNPNAGLKEIKFKASLDLETKVTATSFEEGDVIGLSVGEPIDASRVKLTYTGGALTPEKTLYWPESMAYLAEASFMAWYPYDIFGDLDPMGNTIHFIIARDQYREGKYEESDLLAAVTSASPAQETVALEFRHKFSRLKLKVVDQLTSDSFRDSQADSFRSIGLKGLKRQAGVNLAEGSVEAYETSEDVIYPMRASEMNYWAIVVPQTATPEIVVTLNSGETRTYVPSAPIIFNGGKQLSATLTLSDEAVSFQWNIVDWEDDDTEIIFVQPDGDQPDNEIWYTSTDGEVVTLFDEYGDEYLLEFGANVVSNTYENGKGVILFDGPITRVAPFAFNHCTSLLTVRLPESVTSLGSACFQSCRNLESIYLPDGITVIESAAFNICYNLSNIILPRNLVYIEHAAFSSCSSIVSLDFPDSFESLESSVFDSCTRLERFSGKYASQDGRCLIIDNTLWAFASAGLTEYTIPAGVTGIGSAAFFYCSGLKSIVIPESVTEIGDYAFCYCSSISTYAIPNGVTYIGGSAFSHNNSLESFTGALATDDGRGLVLDGELVGFAKHGLTSWEIPTGVTALASSVFLYCDELTNITIPQTVTVIGESAFCACSSLQTIKIPDSVTTIGNRAFERCTGLKSITIPQNVKRFDYVFDGANSITEFYVLPTVPPTLSNSSNFITSPDYIIYVPAASVDAYKIAQYWNDLSEHIQAFPEPEPVDLGLESGTKWASFNLGAGSPEGAGCVFAWGELGPRAPKVWHTWDDYRFGNSVENLTKYNSQDNLVELEAEDDAVVFWLGTDWRMPTLEQREEFYNNCTFTEVTVNGVSGYEAKSKINDNTLFLPYVDEYPDLHMSFYWISTLNDEEGANVLAVFSDYGVQIGNSCARYTAHPIRPVYVGE